MIERVTAYNKTLKLTLNAAHVHLSPSLTLQGETKLIWS